MTDYMRDSRFQCQDCGHDTKLMGELYVVHTPIWEYATFFQSAYMLCVGCIEIRLGRKLQRRDFTEAPLNWREGFTRSLRLRHRLWNNT